VRRSTGPTAAASLASIFHEAGCVVFRRVVFVVSGLVSALIVAWSVTVAVGRLAAWLLVVVSGGLTPVVGGMVVIAGPRVVVTARGGYGAGRRR
jgi:hypothetical protein